MNNIERTGPHFDFEKYLEARKITKQVVLEVASLIEVGMSELDGHQVIEDALVRYNCEKKWHPSKFRIGKNTIKSFGELSESDVQLGKDDLFFLDIGPVFNGHEGDYGETFSVGNNEEYIKIKDAIKSIFKKAELYYKENGPTGIELYEKTDVFCRELGYRLNLKMSGHRLGDFPHALFSKGKLADINFMPKENLWVLEILIRHPEKNFGAFFEDIIT